MHAGNLAFTQIHTAYGIQGQRRCLHCRQGQLLRCRYCKALRQHGGHGQIIAHDDDIAQIFLPQQAVDGFLRINHSRERNFHPLHVFIGSDDSVRINLRRFFGQISFLCEDGQIDAVILQTQIFNARRICVKINVCRIFHNVAQHAGNLFAGFGPCGLLLKGNHIAGRILPCAVRLCEDSVGVGDENGNHQNHRNNFFYVPFHFFLPLPIMVICLPCENNYH